MQSNAHRFKAAQSNATQGKATQNNAKQCRAMHSDAKHCNVRAAHSQYRDQGRWRRAATGGSRQNLFWEL
eukprot:9485031-Pyramimonas_sp.AAC.1